MDRRASGPHGRVQRRLGGARRFRRLRSGAASRRGAPSGGRLVRWAEVFAWSGVALDPGAQFHTIALPSRHPAGPAPWRGQGPAQGRLYLPDAEALADILARFTTTAGDCWFCLWDGYDLAAVPATSAGAPPTVALADPVPAEVRRGPRVKLPGRDYLLYAGPVEAITAYGPGRAQTANLAWPVDRAWFVASEVDLAWTYLAGSEALVEAVLADYRIEALPAGPDDPLTTIDAHVAGLVERYRCRHARRCRGSVVVASRVRLLPAVDGHPRRLGPGGRCRRSRWLAERSLWPGADMQERPSPSRPPPG